MVAVNVDLRLDLVAALWRKAAPRFVCFEAWEVFWCAFDGRRGSSKRASIKWSPIVLFTFASQMYNTPGGLVSVTHNQP